MKTGADKLSNKQLTTHSGYLDVKVLYRYIRVAFFIFLLLFGNDAYTASTSYAATNQTTYAIEHPKISSKTVVSKEEGNSSLYRQSLKESNSTAATTPETNASFSSTPTSPVKFKANSTSTTTPPYYDGDYSFINYQGLTRFDYSDLNFTSLSSTGIDICISGATGCEYTDGNAEAVTTAPATGKSARWLGQIFIDTTDANGLKYFELTAAGATATFNANLSIDGVTVISGGAVCGTILPYQCVAYGSLNTTIGWHKFDLQVQTTGTLQYNSYNFDIMWGNVSGSYGNSVIPIANLEPTVPRSHSYNTCLAYPSHVDPVTGNFCEQVEDIGLPNLSGSDLSLAVARTYNSLGYGGYFGQGWSSIFDIGLWPAGVNLTAPLFFIMPDGRADKYMPIDGDMYHLMPPPGSNTTITATNTCPSGCGVGYNGIVTITTASQITYTLNNLGGSANYTVRIQDRNSNQISTTYSNGSLYLSDNYGRIITATTNNQRIDSITDGTRTVYYGYDSTFTYLQTVTDTRGNVTHYNYDPVTKQLSQIIDQYGNPILQNTYTSITDTHGYNVNLITSQVITAGTNTVYNASFDYSQVNTAQTGTTIFTNARGFTTTYDIDYSNMLVTKVTDSLSNQTSFQYNPDEKVITLTNPLQIPTTLSYTTMGRPTQINTKATVNGQSGQTIGVGAAYNPLNDPTVITDTRNHQINLGYDGKGNLKTVTDQLNQTANYEYGPSGQLLSSSSVGGLRTVYSYSGSTGSSGGGSYPPVVLAVSPNGGATGSSIPITITGLYFTSLPTAKLGTTSLTGITFDSASQIRATVPSSLASGTYTLTVTNPDGQSSSLPNAFTVSVGGHFLTSSSSTSAPDLSPTFQSHGSPSGSSQPGLPDFMIQAYPTTVPGNTGLGGQAYRTNFGYNPQGWVAYQSDPFTGTSPTAGVNYIYNNWGQILTTTNQLGQNATNEYDKVGNLVRSVNFLGQETLYGYDWLRRTIAVTQTVTGGSGSLVTQYAYDGANNVTSVTIVTGPDNSVANYTYDELNRVKTMTMALRAGGTAQTSYGYDSVGNLTFITRTNSTTAGNQVTHYEYDEAHRVITTTVGYGSSNPWQQVNTLDQAGNITQFSQRVNGSKNVLTSISYDNLNRPLTNTLTMDVGPNLVTSYSYNDPQNSTTTTDPYGIVTTLIKDAAGRPIQTTITPSSLGGPTQNSYNYYDSYGMLIRSLDPLNNQVDYGYDQWHREISRTTYTAPNGGGTALTSLTYYTNTARPQITTVGPAPQNERQDRFFDEANRLITSTVYTQSGVSYPTVPNGALTTSYTYDGQSNMTSMTDPTRNHTLTFSYERTGWLLSAVEPISGTNNTTNYTYDLLGNRLSIQDSANHTTQFGYDTLNRVISETDGIGTWQMTYDGMGRMTSRTGANASQSTAYTVDNAGWVRQANSQPNNLVTNFNYNLDGQPISMTDTIGGINYTTVYTYDGLNRLVSTSNLNGLIQYGYDAANRRTSLQFGPNSGSLKAVSYGYDAMSRPVTIANWISPTQPLNYSYSGQYLNQINYPNTVVANYSFDGAGRLTGITQTQGANTIFSTAYTLDALGNRTLEAENVNGLTRQVRYGYDEASRLVQEIQPVGSGATQHNITSTYSYDGSGSRTQMVTVLPPNTKGSSATILLTTTYGYDSTAGRLTSRSEASSATGFHGNAFTYSYDSNGNLNTESNNTGTNAEVTSYGYDARNRLTSWQKTKSSTPAILSSATFLYDGANNRLSLTYASQPISYLQDPIAVYPVALQETKGGQVSSFMYPVNSTSPLFQSDSSSNSMWYHADGLGSVRALTSNSGVVSSTNSYSAFGSNQGETGKASNDHLFAGEQLDPTGLYYNRARYYNPSIGRFINRDTVVGTPTSPQSLNRYTYAGNNPVDFADPSGNCPPGQYCQDKKDNLCDQLPFSCNNGIPLLEPSLLRNQQQFSQPSMATGICISGFYAGKCPLTMGESGTTAPGGPGGPGGRNKKLNLGQDSTNGENDNSWPPDAPTGSKPALGSEGADTWRYQRYLYQSFLEGAAKDDLLSFEAWKKRYYNTALTEGARPGRPGGPAQTSTRDYLATKEGFTNTENTQLGERQEGGETIKNMVDMYKKNDKGGIDYVEVDEIIQKGIPKALLRGKLKSEIPNLGENDRLIYIDKVDPSKRITYNYGDGPDVVDTRTWGGNKLS